MDTAAALCHNVCAAKGSCDLELILWKLSKVFIMQFKCCNRVSPMFSLLEDLTIIAPNIIFPLPLCW